MKKLLLCITILLFTATARAQTAGTVSGDDLVIAQNGRTSAVIVVSPEAGIEKKPGLWQQYLDGKINERVYKASPVTRPWENEAALDLQKYIELISGARPEIARTPETIATALKSTAPVFVVGEEALKVAPSLQAALDKVKKSSPVLRADAIAMRRAGNRVYLAGTNDDSHYYAVSWLLQQWGVRWYLPTSFGECISKHETLAVGRLDYAYAPPFEVRRFWISWNGSIAGMRSFQHRNMFNEEVVPSYHTVANFVKGIVPEGKKHNQIPYSDPKIAAYVADQVAARFEKGEYISLGMQDGIYSSTDPEEEKIKAGLFDKYYLLPSMTEPFMVFYNNVARDLQARYPASKAKIGFLAYTNLTIPPQRDIKAEKSLVAYLAPIDIDPNHPMDDPNSPPRQEFREMMQRWAEVMDGRVVIYDYDQGNLVWRDVPNPSHFVFQKDVKEYLNAGVLGVDTESRGAFATTFLNLYIRGQLMWNPDTDVDALLNDFYPRFYGPAAAPMKDYWSAIYRAWQSSIATEHEYFTIPAIYTPQLIAGLEKSLASAEMALGPLKNKQPLAPAKQQYLDRLKWTRLGFGVIQKYGQMHHAAAVEADYARAANIGAEGLAIRKELTELNPIFTSTRLETGTAWWPGEVAQYAELEKLVNGEKGTLIAKLPQQWAFRRDPHDTGLVSGWAYKPIDLTFWEANKNKYTTETRRDYPATQWEMLDTDLYIQAQGVRFPDNQGFTGHGWYRTTFNLTAVQAKSPVHLMFPGLMNEAWLYVNGALVAHRTFPTMWWNSDYKFEWDADISTVARPGENTITLRIYNPHHMGGIFRRPFLHQPSP